MAGLWVGQAFGVFLLPGLRVGGSTPRFLGNQPAPCATQALIKKKYLVATHLQGGSLLINPEQNRIGF